MSYLESKGLIGHSFRGIGVPHLEVGDLRVPGGRVQNIGHCFGHSAVSGRSPSENYLIPVQEKATSAV